MRAPITGLLLCLGHVLSAEAFGYRFIRDPPINAYGEDAWNEVTGRLDCTEYTGAGKRATTGIQVMQYPDSLDPNNPADILGGRHVKLFGLWGSHYCKGVPKIVISFYPEPGTSQETLFATLSKHSLWFDSQTFRFHSFAELPDDPRWNLLPLGGVAVKRSGNGNNGARYNIFPNSVKVDDSLAAVNDLSNTQGLRQREGLGEPSKIRLTYTFNEDERGVPFIEKTNRNIGRRKSRPSSQLNVGTEDGDENEEGLIKEQEGSMEEEEGVQSSKEEFSSGVEELIKHLDGNEANEDEETEIFYDKPVEKKLKTEPKREHYKEETQDDLEDDEATDLNQAILNSLTYNNPNQAPGYMNTPQLQGFINIQPRPYDLNTQLRDATAGFDTDALRRLGNFQTMMQIPSEDVLRYIQEAKQWSPVGQDYMRQLRSPRNQRQLASTGEFGQLQDPYASIPGMKEPLWARRARIAANNQYLNQGGFPIPQPRNPRQRGWRHRNRGLGSRGGIRGSAIHYGDLSLDEMEQIRLEAVRRADARSVDTEQRATQATDPIEEAADTKTDKEETYNVE